MDYVTCTTIEFVPMVIVENPLDFDRLRKATTAPDRVFYFKKDRKDEESESRFFVWDDHLAYGIRTFGFAELGRMLEAAKNGFRVAKEYEHFLELGLKEKSEYDQYIAGRFQSREEWNDFHSSGFSGAFEVIRERGSPFGSDIACSGTTDIFQRLPEAVSGEPDHR